MQFRIWTVVLLILGFSSCQKEKLDLVFEETTVAPGYWLTDVDFRERTQGYFVGGSLFEQGILVSSYDEGKSWQLDSITDRILNGVEWDEAGNWSMAGFNGYFYQGVGGSLPGTFVRLPIWDQIQDVSRLEDGSYVFVSAVGTDSGNISVLNASMQLDTVFSYPNSFFALDQAPNGVLHAVGYGLVLRSGNSGREWRRADVDGDIFRDVHFPEAQVGYAVGSSGTIIKTTDGGSTWVKIRNGGGIWQSNLDFRAVHFIDADRGFIAGFDGLLWRTNNGGEDWSVIRNAPDRDYLCLFVDRKFGWLGTRDGSIVRFVW